MAITYLCTPTKIHRPVQPPRGMVEIRFAVRRLGVAQVNIMKHYTADADTMFAQAKSLHWSAGEAYRSLNQNQSPISFLEPLGNMLTYVILQSLAAEIALKASQMNWSGYFTRGHNLVELFDEMRPDVQNAVDILYSLLVQTSFSSNILPNPVTVEPIRDVLERHAADFEDWRYLFELNQTEIKFFDIRLATLAIILHFDIVRAGKEIGNGDITVLIKERMLGL